MTLIELIATQSARLSHAGVSFGHGTKNALDEATWLVRWSLGLPMGKFWSNAHRELSDEECARAEALLTRRIETRWPTAYLTNEAWLMNVPFYVDERTIVPRSFIGELLAHGRWESTLNPWLRGPVYRVLDMCTGNGSLAVIAAMAHPEITIDACDISEDALAVARINVERHKLSHRIRLLQSDLFTNIHECYDLIICNPPYINKTIMATLPAEFRAEPALALDGGDDGMDLVHRIFADAPAHMNDAAVMVLEIGYERHHFEHAIPNLEVVWLETSGGRDQVLLVTRNGIVSRARE